MAEQKDYSVTREFLMTFIIGLLAGLAILVVGIGLIEWLKI